MKHVKMFGKSVPLIAIVLVGLLTIGASAVLLTQYGQVGLTATMEQSVLIDGGTSVTDILDPGIGGRTYCYPYTLENRGHKEAPIYFTAIGDPDLGGVTLSYLKPVEYTADLATAGGFVGYVTVEDLGEWIKWTFDVIGDRTPTPADLASGGSFEYGLVISLEGDVGDKPTFHVHGNGGIDPNYPWGTHLYTEYDAGWHNGFPDYENIPISAIDWIEATGKKSIAENPTGVYTIAIKRCYLGESFSWGVQLATASGFPDLGYGFSTLPTVFDWVTVSEYKDAVVAEDIDPYTLAMLETLDLYIVYDFDSALVPDIYTITSTVKVGP